MQAYKWHDSLTITNTCYYLQFAICWYLNNCRSEEVGAGSRLLLCFFVGILTKSLLCTVNNGIVLTKSATADSLVGHKCTLLVDKALSQHTKAVSLSGYKRSGRLMLL